MSTSFGSAERFDAEERAQRRLVLAGRRSGWRWCFCQPGEEALDGVGPFVDRRPLVISGMVTNIRCREAWASTSWARVEALGK